MITIKNLKKEKMENAWDVKVCRPTIFGNPFVPPSGITEDKRDEVCDLYKEYFYKNLNKFKPHLDKLIIKYNIYGKLNLFCYCSPKRCHSQTIKEYLEKELNIHN